jgi:predicted nucleic acid-binding protein
VTLYVDSSALLKLYVEESESREAAALLGADPDWVCGAHTTVEVRRNLARLLSGASLRDARTRFARQWRRVRVVDLDERTCDLAAELAEETGARALDALHLGAAQRAGEGVLPLVTYDRRQAAAARELGWTVLGG